MSEPQFDMVEIGALKFRGDSPEVAQGHVWDAGAGTEYHIRRKFLRVKCTRLLSGEPLDPPFTLDLNGEDMDDLLDLLREYRGRDA